MLEKLKSFKATTESLKSTKIGVFVTDLRRRENATDKIKEACREVVKKWKEDVNKDTNTNNNGKANASSSHGLKGNTEEEAMEELIC